jgi:hypothetical protein
MTTSKPKELKKTEPQRKTVTITLTPDDHYENTPGFLRKQPLVSHEADPNSPDQVK